MICGPSAKAYGQPHVTKLWWGASKCKLPVKYFHSNKSHFSVSSISLHQKTVTTSRGTWPPSLFGDMARCKSVMSVCSHQSQHPHTQMAQQTTMKVENENNLTMSAMKTLYTVLLGLRLTLAAGPLHAVVTSPYSSSPEG